MRPIGTRVPVGRGTGPVRALPRRSEPLLNLPVAGRGGARPLAERLAETHTDAFVVLHAGDVVTEWYRDEAVAETPQALMSITKSVIGCVCGALAGRGRVDTGARVADVLPELADSGYAETTVRDLLDMRTGGDYVEEHDDPGSEVAAIGRALLTPGPGTPTLADLIRRTPRVARHAGPFSYRSLDTEVLGRVLERVAGLPMPRLIEQELLGPLGAELPGSMAVDADGAAHHGGGLALVPRDLARFGRLILDGGAVGDRQLVPTAFLKDTRVGGPDSRVAFLQGASRQQVVLPTTVSTIYRNQFWVLHQAGRQLLGIGIHGQLLFIDADNDVVVVKLSTWPTPREPHAFAAGLDCAAAAAESVGGRSLPHPPIPHRLTQES